MVDIYAVLFLVGIDQSMLGDVWKSKASIDREMSVLLVTVMLN